MLPFVELGPMTALGISLVFWRLVPAFLTATYHFDVDWSRFLFELLD